MAVVESAAVRPVKLTDLAEELGVDPATLWRWVAIYKLTKFRVAGHGKATFLDADEVQRKVAKPRRV